MNSLAWFHPPSGADHAPLGVPANGGKAETASDAYARLPLGSRVVFARGSTVGLSAAGPTSLAPMASVLVPVIAMSGGWWAILDSNQ